LPCPLAYLALAILIGIFIAMICWRFGSTTLPPVADLGPVGFTPPIPVDLRHLLATGSLGYLSVTL
jgi:hypothetical protein